MSLLLGQYHTTELLSITNQLLHFTSLHFTSLHFTQLNWSVWIWSYATIDGQSASLSWNQVPIWNLRPNFYYCQTVAGLLIWGVFSDERTGLSFTVAAGPRQRSHSRVRLSWDSRPYFTVSDSKLHFSSPPTTHRATVEVFDSASTQGWTGQLVGANHVENTALLL
jgi:hypothetical protein